MRRASDAPLRSKVAMAVLVSLLLVGCAGNEAIEEGNIPRLDTGFTLNQLWDDGRAEVAFYDLTRTRTPYGEGEPEEILVGTYLVKQDFSPGRMSKAVEGDEDAVSAFKSAIFYSFTSGSYEYRRAWVSNARQEDLRPLKSSFTMFDWCANSYREFAIPLSGEASFLYRSDDYGNDAGSFSYRAGSVPAEMIPLLVRGLVLQDGEEVTFHVIMHDGNTVQAVARSGGRTTFQLEGEMLDAVTVEVRYDAEVVSVLAEIADLEERYVIEEADARRLLAIEGATGAYRLTLREAIRSAYWEEDIWERLRHVSRRP